MLIGSTNAAPADAPPDLSHQPVLYMVGYAHLDTEWRWEYPQVIQEYLPKTMLDNFALIEKYPHYIFNFTGAYRYELMKEYYPESYKRLKAYVAAGRWFPAGSSVDENDVNSPSAESIIRQVLYGNEFFRHEFGKASLEYMLPDCFGFPASLPSILAHCGIKGFSTQKLSSAWQPAPHVGGPDSPEETPEGIPFNVGIWVGPDGQSVIAALNPGSYGGRITTDLTKSPTPEELNPPGSNSRRFRPRNLVDWPKRIDLDGKVTGIYADYHYYGTGDTGGSPTEDSVKLVEAMLTHGTVTLAPPRAPWRFRQEPPEASPPATPVRVGDGPVRVVSATSDQMFKDILNSKPDFSRFPHYKGDLELINHSAGSLTSEAYHKRWNRKKELLAAAAERASVAAMWLGGKPYPQERLTRAWMLTLAGQMHDILPGTATPKAYEYAWNDDAIAMNQFADVLCSAAESVASAMNTQTKGSAIVVYNPLNVDREDVVETDISLPEGPNKVRVTGPDGAEVPAQVSNGKLLFLAKVPSVGFAVYDVETNEPPTAISELKVTESSLENARYRVKLDENGDVSSIFDKSLERELLSAPIRLALSTDNPRQWPAWNMDYDQVTNAPRAYVSGPAKVHIVENGPVRVAVAVERETEGSKFVQTIRLSAGDAGNRVECGNSIDWNSTNCNLKATFPFTASNLDATYNLDVGTIQRPTETERQFEVGSHQWIDLTDKGGDYGVTVLTDCKYGSDKRDDHTLRLTLIRTPGVRGGYTDQASQDLGHHEFVFGLAGHRRDWRQGQTDWQGQRLNQPLIAFESSKHPGTLGKSFCLMKANDSRVRLLALKKAENSDEVIARFVELNGENQSQVHISFAAPVVSAREVNGQEQPVGPASVSGGDLVTSFSPYQLRTFALKLAPPAQRETAPQWQAVTLPYDRCVTSEHGKESVRGFDDVGRALPAEMLPKELTYDGVDFKLGPSDGANAVVCHGQSIVLPHGMNRVYVLAASAQGDQEATFKAGEEQFELTVQDWTEYIGQWDRRLWTTTEELPRFGFGGLGGFPFGGPPPAGPPAGGFPARGIRPGPGGPPPRGFPPAGFRRRGGRQNIEPRTVATYSGLMPGYMKRSPIAWYASHHHLADGSSTPYSYSYLFAYEIDVPNGADTLTLPDNDAVRVLAVTAAREDSKVTAAMPLYDTLKRSGQNDLRTDNSGI